MPSDLKGFVTQFAVHPILVIVAICAIYVVLGHGDGGAVDDPADGSAFLPVVTALGFDPIWFGIIIVIVVQIGLISPPVGMNIFVVRACCAT